MSAEQLSLVDKVLAYVSSPFRLFAMVLMAVLTFAGYFVYTNQELLIGAYKESKKIPSIAEDRVEDAAAHLFKQLLMELQLHFQLTQYLLMLQGLLHL